SHLLVRSPVLPPTTRPTPPAPNQGWRAGPRRGRGRAGPHALPREPAIRRLRQSNGRFPPAWRRVGLPRRSGRWLGPGRARAFERRLSAGGQEDVAWLGLPWSDGGCAAMTFSLQACDSVCVTLSVVVSRLRAGER